MHDYIGVNWTLVEINFHFVILFSFWKANQTFFEIHLNKDNIALPEPPLQGFGSLVASLFLIGMAQRNSVYFITLLPYYIAPAAWAWSLKQILLHYFRMAYAHTHKTLILIVSLNTKTNFIIRFCQCWPDYCSEIQIIYDKDDKYVISCGRWHCNHALFIFQGDGTSIKT